MKKYTLIAVGILLSLLFATTRTQAQSKVFKEVGEDISSQVKPIWQDGAMVGYLVFTQLEKASADSFNYKITIMDENLNDIGTVKFREQKLALYDVAFEQDVLCLAYLKSNVIGVTFKNNREYKAALPGEKTYVYTQFLGLNGKIIGANAVRVAVKPFSTAIYGGVQGDAKLKFGVLLKNIPQKGFAVSFGDDNKNNLLVYNPAGKQVWQKAIAEEASNYYMLTSQQDVWFLVKKTENVSEGGYSLLGFNTGDSTVLPKQFLLDKQGHQLRVITFDNDPATGRPFLAGSIIDQQHGGIAQSYNQIRNGAYDGVFTIDIAGHKKSDFHENYSYWNDGSKPEISKRGRFESKEAYCKFEQAFRDYNGNTYFSGSATQHKVRWGSIAATVITLPIIVPPIVLAAAGYNKARLADGMVVKLGAKGTLSNEDAIALNKTNWIPGKFPFSMVDGRSYFHMTNSETKTDYLIVDDTKNITIYNVNQKKVQRTIPHYEGKTHKMILPAKEGHVMISEYNQKEKYTQVSIEAL
jgi:hypothetical protein